MDREGRREVKAARRRLAEAKADVTASNAAVKSAAKMYELSKTNAEALSNVFERESRAADDSRAISIDADKQVGLAKTRANAARKKASSASHKEEAMRAEELAEAAEKMSVAATRIANEARGRAEIARETATLATGNLRVAAGGLRVARAQLEYLRRQAKEAEDLMRKAHEKWGGFDADSDRPSDVEGVDDNPNSEGEGKVGDEGRKKRQKTVSDYEDSSDVDSQTHVEADSAFGDNDDDGKASADDGNLGGRKPHMEEEGGGKGKKASASSIAGNGALDTKKPSDVCSVLHGITCNDEVGVTDEGGGERGEELPLASDEGKKSQKTSASLPDEVLSASNMSDGGDEEVNEDSRGKEGENLQRGEKRMDQHAPPLRGGAGGVPGRRQGPPSPHPPHVVTPGGLSPAVVPGQRTEQEKKEEKRFLRFLKVLMKFLEQCDTDMHALAKRQIYECHKKNESGDPEFKSLIISMRSRLRATVGEDYWKKAHDYLDHCLKQKREKNRQLALAFGDSRDRPSIAGTTDDGIHAT